MLCRNPQALSQLWQCAGSFGSWSPYYRHCAGHVSTTYWRSFVVLSKVVDMRGGDARSQCFVWPDMSHLLGMLSLIQLIYGVYS
jgi:hypothetical protein